MFKHERGFKVVTPPAERFPPAAAELEYDADLSSCNRKKVGKNLKNFTTCFKNSGIPW